MDTIIIPDKSIGQSSMGDSNWENLTIQEMMIFIIIKENGAHEKQTRTTQEVPIQRKMINA